MVASSATDALVVDRPHSAFFRYAGPGTMIAKAAASTPTTVVGRRIARVRAFVFGKPLTNQQDVEERLTKKLALPIFSSDAISSSAYATDEILRVLILAGVAWMTWSIFVAAAIALMLTIVAFSYRQVCRGYPSGGGAYVVARENLSPNFGLIAAAALMVDYVMTVAVSSASALANLGTAFSVIQPYKVELGALVIILVTAANLRGIRESGKHLRHPDLFVRRHGPACDRRGPGKHRHRRSPPPRRAGIRRDARRAGLHAVAGPQGVRRRVRRAHRRRGNSQRRARFQAARGQERRQHADHHGRLAGGHLHRADVRRPSVRRPGHDCSGPTVLGQVGNAVFGGGFLFILLQVSAALILFLACNTSFNAFPRLAAILAKDDCMPRQFAFRGDRLAFSWGIVILAAVSIAMLWAFDASVDALIPLYSVGVSSASPCRRPAWSSTGARSGVPGGPGGAS